MSLVTHYWMGDVQDNQCLSASEMTDIVTGGALNSIHSLTHAFTGLAILVAAVMFPAPPKLRPYGALQEWVSSCLTAHQHKIGYLVPL